MLLAQEEAKRLGHRYIGTEHLLLGLIQEGEGIAARVLTSLGMQAATVREAVEQMIGKSAVEVSGDIGYTPRAKKVVELSYEEARRLGHNYVGTEHILLGLIHEGEGVAARVLHELGADLEKVRNRVIEVLGGFAATGPAPAAPKSQVGNTNTPTLNEFGRDLNVLARESKIDPVIGRNNEIERVIQILSRRTKNNPVLIGEPGVGKTAIAEGLAQKIVEGNVPETLKDKRVVSLSMGTMVAGSKYRGEFEERMKKVIDEIYQAKNIVLFIDELHTLIGAGGAEGAVDAANILKPSLARGELQVIGATTLDEYKKHIEKDAALERRFQPIMVGEPTADEAIEILKGLRDRYEAHHRAKITDEAITAAVKLTDRYITDRFLPDKAIDAMDEASSRVRLKVFVAPPGIKEVEEKLEKVGQEKESAIQAQEFEQAAQLRDQEQKLRQTLASRQKEWQQDQNSEQVMVTEEDIAHVVSSWTGIPVKKLAEGESERLLKMEDILHERVIGQSEAVAAVARAVRRARSGLKDPKRPIGSFTFLGPTGVGKTELARALAEALFGAEEAMIRLDMSEYMEKHTVSRLVGAPPGYVGYEEGGQLTEAVRRKPYCVILLDEIEKAHPDVFNILLQVLEDGRLTDGKGRTVDFRNTVVIMTSNVGAQHLRKDALGFLAGTQTTKNSYQEMKNRIMEEVKKTFRPEFLNRIDELIIFHTLTDEHLVKIVELMLKSLSSRLAEHEMQLTITDQAKTILIKEGNDPVYGARPLRRAIQKMVEDPISEMILRQETQVGVTIVVDALDNELTFSIKQPAMQE
jgi:ATP-dependent Clp protease ATP-binding subunit ClpC